MHEQHKKPVVDGEAQKAEKPEKNEKKPRKKLSNTARYIINIMLVLILTVGMVAATVAGPNFTKIMENLSVAFSGPANVAWLLGALGLMLAAFFVESMVLFCFSRLYTRHFTIPQALAAHSVKTFYDSIDPIQTAGKVMQANTMKKQKVSMASAASIIVMTFIVYQVALIVMEIISFILKHDAVINLTFTMFGANMPLWWVALIGFVVDIGNVVFPILLAFSKLFKKAVNKIILLLGKMKIIKNPASMIEKANIQIETFRIELKRLLSNIPLFILVVLLFCVALFIRGGIPYFVAQSINSISEGATFFDFVFLTKFHEMIASIFLTPGNSGATEIIYITMFQNCYVNADTQGPAAQIIWRTITYTLPLIVTGFVSAFYKSSSKPKEHERKAGYQMMIDIQLSTFDERKRSSDVIFETAQLNRQLLQERIFRKKINTDPLDGLSIKDESEVIVYFAPNRDEKRKKTEKITPVKKEKKQSYKRINTAKNKDIDQLS